MVLKIYCLCPTYLQCQVNGSSTKRLELCLPNLNEFVVKYAIALYIRDSLTLQGKLMVAKNVAARALSTGTNPRENCDMGEELKVMNDEL